MSDFVRQYGCENIYSDDEPWIILPAIELQIQKKINDVGIPLKEWDININRGILTGFNEAFIIDGKKRDQLIAEDPKSAEIIRPILRGRDIHRYSCGFADKWLIATLPSKHYDIEEFPAIKNHLLSFGINRLEQTGMEYVVNGNKIKARKKTNNLWYETQDSISYWEDFSKQKMVWKRIGSIIRFCYDESGTFTLDSTCIATGEGVKYLVAILNSRLGHYLLKDSPKTGTGDLLISVQAIEPVNIPRLKEVDQKPFIQLLDEIIECQSQNTPYKNYENELDNLVFELYQLSNEEREYVMKNFR